MDGLTFMHSLDVVHGDLKAVRHIDIFTQRPH
jgi:hypothetical protein